MKGRERGHAQGLGVAGLIGLRQTQRRRQRQGRGASLAGPHPQGCRGPVDRDDAAAGLQGHRALARLGIERRDKGFQRQTGQMRRHPARRHTRCWRRHSGGGHAGRFSAFARQGLPGRADAGMAATAPLRRRHAFRRRPRVAEQVGGGQLAGKGQATAMLHRARSRSPGPARGFSDAGSRPEPAARWRATPPQRPCEALPGRSAPRPDAPWPAHRRRPPAPGAVPGAMDAPAQARAA